MKYKIYKKNLNVGEITIKNQISENVIKLIYEEIGFYDYKTIKVRIDRNTRDYQIQYSSLREKNTYEKWWTILSSKELIILPWELYLFIVINESNSVSNLIIDTVNCDYSLVIAPVVADLCTTPVALSAPPNSYQNNSQS